MGLSLIYLIAKVVISKFVRTDADFLREYYHDLDLDKPDFETYYGNKLEEVHEESLLSEKWFNY